MSNATSGLMVVGKETTVVAQIRNCARLEVFGYVEGEVTADQVIVHDGGQVYGTVRAGEADIAGTLQGKLAVRNRVRIRSTADVSGDVQYGSLALEAGGTLTAELKNVPPQLVGDFSVTVARGKAVRLTTLDIAAVDPDDAPENLIYRVSGEVGGHVALAANPTAAVATFSQTDIERGQVLFVHAGSPEQNARFEVVVSDASGATSGAPRAVDVIVREAGAAA
ncbi:MAG: polymer-forming cytoskeletal protein [Hyphomicrobiaceae bacterium]